MDERHRAKRSLGQNFLVDENICRRIVDAVAPGPEDVVVEIGPGRGALTRFLADAGARRFIALEKDHALAEELAGTYPQAEVVDGDALAFDFDALSGERLKLVGNLPYNVASRIIWDAAGRIGKFERAVFMVQHEVGQRLAARPATRTYGALSVWVQAFCRVEYLFKVGPGVFRPRPKVDSAVMRLTQRDASDRPKAPNALAALVKMCFQKRRKQLGTILRGRLAEQARSWFSENDVQPCARPEVLTPEQFASLAFRLEPFF